LGTPASTKRPAGQRTYRILFAVLLTLLLLLQYRLWVGPGSLSQRLALQREIATQRDQNQQLETRNRAIIDEIEVLASGAEGLEELARSRLGMIGADEVFYLLPEQPAPTAPAPESANEAP